MVYLDGDRTPRKFTLSNTRNAPDLGIVHVTEPLGWALYGAEEGDDIEVLVGNSVRMAKIEKVIKNGGGAVANKPVPEPPVPAQVDTPGGDLFGAKSPPAVPASVKLDPARFYEPGYVRTLTILTCDLVDRLGPMTFRHLSELVARAHGFQRTGSQIKSQVWSAISKSRRHSRDGKGGESTIWPKGMDPLQVVPFRGMTVAGEQREWPYVPYPEKLGLAIEIRTRARGDDLAGQMANRIGLARLKQTTRAELEDLLKDAQSATREA